MKISIETIGDKQCTVIRKPFDAEWVKEQLSMGNTVVATYEDTYPGGTKKRTNRVVIDKKINKPWLFQGEYSEQYNPKTVTILQPLPKYPKKEDASLLYGYMAEGLHPLIKNQYSHEEIIIGWCKEGQCWRTSTNCWGDGRSLCRTTEITHATHNGNRVDVAIGDDDAIDSKSRY